MTASSQLDNDEDNVVRLTLGLPLTAFCGSVTLSVRMVLAGATEEVALEQEDGEVSETEEGALETEGEVDAHVGSCCCCCCEGGKAADLAVKT